METGPTAGGAAGKAGGAPALAALRARLRAATLRSEADASEETLGDQLVGARGIGRAQQRLRQAHQRFALHTVERELLEHPLDQGPRALIGARDFHPARSAHSGALERALNRRQICECLTRGGPFRAQCRGAQLCAQRSQRARAIRRVDQSTCTHVADAPARSELRLF